MDVPKELQIFENIKMEKITNINRTKRHWHLKEVKKKQIKKVRVCQNSTKIYNIFLDRISYVKQNQTINCN